VATRLRLHEEERAAKVAAAAGRQAEEVARAQSSAAEAEALSRERQVAEVRQGSVAALAAKHAKVRRALDAEGASERRRAAAAKVLTPPHHHPRCVFVFRGFQAMLGGAVGRCRSACACSTETGCALFGVSAFA
jgi:hypothetical protein